MRRQITVGSNTFSPDKPVWIVAEIGINHNGSLDLAKELIQAAARAGCNAVKLQKRTIDIIYSAKELAKPRHSPFGVTNGDLKRGLEFSLSQYRELMGLATSLGMTLFASAWDEAAVADLKCLGITLLKISSACLTDIGLLRAARATNCMLILSTGMSTESEISRAVRAIGTDRLVLLHAVSSYPTPTQELNLRKIRSLQRIFPEVPVGYSGHEQGWYPTLAAVALGARLVERHITTSRHLWGTDQAASLEPVEFQQMVDAIRLIEQGLGDGCFSVSRNERAVRLKLRRK